MNCIKKIIFCSVLFSLRLQMLLKMEILVFLQKSLRYVRYSNICRWCYRLGYLYGSVTLDGTSAKKHFVVKAVDHQNLSVASLPPQASILMPKYVIRGP